MVWRDDQDAPDVFRIGAIRYWIQLGLILAVIFAVVIATEIVTTAIRQRVI